MTQEEMMRVTKSQLLLALASAAGLVITMYAALLWAPTERTMGDIQRIFYVHVPSAWTAFLLACSPPFGWACEPTVQRRINISRGGYNACHAKLRGLCFKLAFVMP